MLIFFGESNFGKGQKDPKGRKKGHIFKEVNMHAFSSQPVGVSQQSTAKILTRTRLMTFVLVAISGQTHSRINVFSSKNAAKNKKKIDPKILFNLSLFNPFLRGFFQLKKKLVCVCFFQSFRWGHKSALWRTRFNETQLNTPIYRYQSNIPHSEGSARLKISTKNSCVTYQCLRAYQCSATMVQK